MFIVPIISATPRTRNGQPRCLTSCPLANKYCTTFALLKASPNCWDIIPLQASPWSVDHLPRKDETPWSHLFRNNASWSMCNFIHLSKQAIQRPIEALMLEQYISTSNPRRRTTSRINWQQVLRIIWRHAYTQLTSTVNLDYVIRSQSWVVPFRCRGNLVHPEPSGPQSFFSPSWTSMTSIDIFGI